MTNFKPAPGLILVRGVRSSGKVGSLYLPDSVRHDADMQFVVLAVGKGCASEAGDRVITTKHPGVAWQPEAPDGPVFRILNEQAEVLARIPTEG